MYLITWITTHLPTPEGWMAELAKARSMQPYIIVTHMVTILCIILAHVNNLATKYVVAQ